MNPSFPSIWIEIKGNFDTNSGNDMIIGGFYREWAQKGISDESAQIERIKILSNQIEYASNKYKNIMILGDANLDMNKWNEPKYKNANVSQVLRECLDQNGLKIEYIGDTYIANHTQKNGNIAMSAIDHIYYVHT